MAQRFDQTIRSTFNKGLLTEYSELNFPNEASVDELNCDLKKAGNRTKRLGLNLEDNYVLTTESYVEGSLYSVGSWTNVGGDSNKQYVVVQVGNKLRFYEKGNYPLSENIVPTSLSDSSAYILDMSVFNKAGGLGASASKVSVTSINGYLVVASPQINTFYISRNSTTGAFTTTQIKFQVRDFGFYGHPDFRTTEIGTSSVSQGRKYDTLNCGWTAPKGDTALSSYISSNSAYPPLTHPWYSGKDSGGSFDLSEWEKIYAGNSVTANGHFILDLFNPDRDAASGLTGVEYYDGREIKDPTDRFNSVAAYAGRVFYGGVGSSIYFSRVLEDINFIGDCYQVNDPTSEEISDLLDTDGGYVRIPDANGIKKLHVFGATLLVFADNGVWRISGVDDVFRATEYSVSKITDFGLAQRTSFVAGANGQPFWWSYNGIHTVVVGDTGAVREINISRETIQTFWNNISSSAKGFVVGEYDAIQNKIVWLYPNNDETVEYKLNNLLFFDVDLQAFYPWKITDEGTVSGNYVVGVAFFNGSGSDEITFNVVDSSGNPVVDSSGNQVVATIDAGSISSSELIFLTREISGRLTFSRFTEVDFLDWGSKNYEAYAESAYNFIGDLGRRKNSPYITTLMRVTETGWAATSGGYTPVRNSSLKVSAYWDFKKTPAATAQEAYRFKYPLVVDTGNLSEFTYPTTVLTTRLKLRGRGRVVKLRFEGQQGKDFNLLGWETLDAQNTTY